MNKSLKKAVIISIVSIVLIGGAVLIFTFASNSQSVNASKQLVSAIENKDLQETRNIIEQYPKSVNTLPSSSPWWYQLITEQPAVLYPLQEACYWGRYDIVKLLIDNGADCNLVWKGIEGSKSPLMCTVLSGSAEAKNIIELLLEQGADKSIKSNGGKTAYDYAVDNGNTELAEILKP